MNSNFTLRYDMNDPAAGLKPQLHGAKVFGRCAGIALIAGVGVRRLATLLAVYCGFTSIFHFIPADPWQMSIFVKNWAIAGGCLCLGVAGSGRLALRPDAGFTFAPGPR